MRTIIIGIVAAAGAAFLGLTGCVYSQLLFPEQFSATSPSSKQNGALNLTMPTFGGLQFWADIRFREGWRVQHNQFTGWYRLLNDHNIRVAWGDRATVIDTFDQLAPPVPSQNDRHLVVLMHGVLASALVFTKFENMLDEAGYSTVAISYASSQRSLEDHTASLEELMNNLEGYDRVSFVAHSMGALVLRKLLSNEADWQKRIDVSRVVQIAPPNQGSVIAERLHDDLLYQAIYGPAGQQLAFEAAQNLPGFDVPFAIIAGGKANDRGYNPLVPGDDDGVVAVAETHLPGAADFIVVDASHSFIVYNDAAIAATLNFLNHGYFTDQH